MTENTGRARHLIAADANEDTGPVSTAVGSEQAVLGTVIQSSAAAAEALAILEPQHFSQGAHQVIYEAVRRLADAGDPVDPMAVMSELARAGVLAKVGSDSLGTGGAFLHSLMERAGSVRYHAPMVLAEWQRFNIRSVLMSAEDLARSPGFDPQVHLEQIRKMVEDATAFAGPSELLPNSETVLEVLEALESEIDPGLSTGYPDLDDAVGGLRPKELIVIGGRPGGGKSLIALCLADHVGSRLNLPVLFASLEMTKEELTQRRIAAAAKVELHHIVRHQVTDWEWDQIHRVQDRLLSTQLYVDDTSQMSLTQIRGKLRAMARTGNPARLLVIDYLGYLAAPRAESRQQAVAELARGAKNLARDFAIPVVLLAQLNRNSENRHDKRPGSADLRESGEIEQSADIILLLHREDAHNPESPRAGELDVLVTKNRQGPETTVTLCFQGHYGRVVSMGRDWSAHAAAEQS